MTQYNRPGYDITVGLWTSAPLCSKMEEYPPDDSTYIQGPSSGNSTCEVKFFACSDPEVSWGHEVGYRYCRKGTGTGSVNLTVTFRCGSTAIASWTHTGIGASVVEANNSLTAAQADAITDYGDVRLRFTQTTASGSGYSAAVTWCYFDCPEVGESGPVVVAPAAQAAAAGRSDPRVVLGSLVLSPAAASAAGSVMIYAVLSSAEVSVTPGAPATARCETTFQFFICPAPASAGTSVEDPTLMMSSFDCAPASPAGAVVATAAPAYVVINRVVVELDLRSRTVSALTVGERPGVYLDERWELEDHSGHWCFEDSSAIILGTGLEGTELNLNSRSLALTVEVPREE